MNAYPVSEMVNIQGVNDPSMLNPFGDKLFSELKPIPAPKKIPKQKPEGLTLEQRIQQSGEQME